jgi:DnaJ-class molecular chaperone
MKTTCASCNGTGRGLFGGPCNNCRGAGTVGAAMTVVQLVIVFAFVAAFIVVVLHV